MSIGFPGSKAHYARRRPRRADTHVAFLSLPPGALNGLDAQRQNPNLLDADEYKNSAWSGLDDTFSKLEARNTTELL